MLNKILKENKGIFLIYGPAASGKTNLCLFLASNLIKNKKKVVYLDTENGFTLSRLREFGCKKEDMDNLFFLKIRNFDEQLEKIKSLEDIKNISLIIIDSLSVFYRKELHENYKEANENMVSQLRTLKHLSEKRPIIITSQVYAKEEEISCVGGKLFSSFCNSVFELVREPKRMCLIKKPEGDSFDFEVRKEGVFIKD